VQVPEWAIDLAVTRVMANRIRTGLFDPLEGQVYTKLGREAVNASWSHDLVLDMTLQSLVLLKNDGTLPLKRGTKVGTSLSLNAPDPHAPPSLPLCSSQLVLQ
jgi:beta-glucosidase-like glycosyl hydrolase